PESTGRQHCSSTNNRIARNPFVFRAASNNRRDFAEHKPTNLCREYLGRWCPTEAHQGESAESIRSQSTRFAHGKYVRHLRRLLPFEGVRPAHSSLGLRRLVQRRVS